MEEMNLAEELERSKRLHAQLTDLKHSARHAATLFGATPLGDAMREFLEDVALVANELGEQCAASLRLAEQMRQNFPGAAEFAERVMSGDVCEQALLGPDDDDGGGVH